MAKNKNNVIEELAKKFVEYSIKNGGASNHSYKNNYQKEIKETSGNTVEEALMRSIDRPNVTYDWNKETREIMVHFGKNGKGLTDEFEVIGEFVKRLSEKAYVYISDAFIDTIDDVYDIKFLYEYKNY